MTRRRLSVVLAMLVLPVSGVAGCGGGDSSSPTAPTSVATPPSNPTASESDGNPGITVDGISLSDLPATQTMSVMPFDPAAVTFISPFKPSHTGIDINTITGGRFLSRNLQFTFAEHADTPDFQTGLGRLKSTGRQRRHVSSATKECW
jgi:hypothetical protein